MARSDDVLVAINDMRLVVETVALVEGQYLFFDGSLWIARGGDERKQLESASEVSFENATGRQDITRCLLAGHSHRSAEILTGLININIVGEKPAIPDHVRGSGKRSQATTDDVSPHSLLPTRWISSFARPALSEEFSARSGAGAISRFRDARIGAVKKFNRSPRPALALDAPPRGAANLSPQNDRMMTAIWSQQACRTPTSRLLVDLNQGRFPPRDDLGLAFSERPTCFEPWQLCCAGVSQKHARKRYER